MQIRRLEKRDWEIYKAMRLEALKSSPGAFSTKYEEERKEADKYWQTKLDNPDDTIFAAFEKDCCLGIVRVSINDPEIPEGYAYVGSLFVSEKHRGKGVAKELMRSAENYAQEIGVNGIYLDVYISQPEAIKLYEGLNYEIIQKRDDVERGDVVMRRVF